MQERPLCDKLSVKRCIEHSPSQHLSKRLQQRNCAMTGSAAKQLFGATEPMSEREDEETNTKQREETVQQPILLPKATSEAECAYIQPLLTERQKEMIIQALISGDAVVHFCEATTGLTTGFVFSKIDQCKRSTAFSIDYSVIYDESVPSLTQTKFSQFTTKKSSYLLQLHIKRKPIVHTVQISHF